MKNRILIIISIVSAVSLFLVGFLTSYLLNNKKEPKVTLTASMIEERIRQCSEFTAAQLEYRGLIRYSEGEIPFINQKSFTMVYVAHVTAGIDFSDVEVEVTDHHVCIRLPKAVLQDVVVNPDSIEFYDEKFALFNWTEREDVTKAIEYAKQDARARIDESGLLNQADAHAKTVLEMLFSPLTENGDAYTLEIVTK